MWNTSQVKWPTAVAAFVAAGLMVSTTAAPAYLQRAPQQPITDFTSNVPVLVLRGDRAGSVSGSKTYSAFTLDIYEPGTNGPARLSNPPTQTMRTGVRLRGMVSRLFPKLSYRLQLQDDKKASLARPLLGMPADADWV